MTEIELRRTVTDLAEHYAKSGAVFEWSAGLEKMIKTYNDHLPLARNYKYVKDGGWCMLFVSDLFIETGLADIMQTEVGPYEAMKADKEAGRFRKPLEYIPLPGDIIYFYYQDKDASGKVINSWYHVAIVTNADKNVIYTTEGNVHHRLLMLAHTPDDPTIAGFGVPDYASKIRPTVDGVIIPPVPAETGIYYFTAVNNGKNIELLWTKKK